MATVFKFEICKKHAVSYIPHLVHTPFASLLHLPARIQLLLKKKDRKRSTEREGIPYYKSIEWKRNNFRKKMEVGAYLTLSAFFNKSSPIACQRCYSGIWGSRCWTQMKRGSGGNCFTSAGVVNQGNASAGMQRSDWSIKHGLKMPQLNLFSRKFVLSIMQSCNMAMKIFFHQIFFTNY